jgi:hypothetical protein
VIEESPLLVGELLVTLLSMVLLVLTFAYQKRTEELRHHQEEATIADVV